MIGIRCFRARMGSPPKIEPAGDDHADQRLAFDVFTLGDVQEQLDLLGPQSYLHGLRIVTHANHRTIRLLLLDERSTVTFGDLCGFFRYAEPLAEHFQVH